MLLDQFFRQMTPDTGMDNANGDQNIDNTVVAQAVAAAVDEVYERTGKDSILVTHSQGGMPGWETAWYTDHIAAIVAIEPGMAPQVDSEDYNALLEKNIPVTFYYGDYIGEEFTDVPAAGIWAMMSSSADAFTEAYTAAGGVSTVIHLPDDAPARGDARLLLAGQEGQGRDQDHGNPCGGRRGAQPAAHYIMRRRS